jgi:hypothetical protein
MSCEAGNMSCEAGNMSCEAGNMVIPRLQKRKFKTHNNQTDTVQKTSLFRPPFSNFICRRCILNIPLKVFSL